MIVHFTLHTIYNVQCTMYDGLTILILTQFIILVRNLIRARQYPTFENITLLCNQDNTLYLVIKV